MSEVKKRNSTVEEDTGCAEDLIITQESANIEIPPKKKWGNTAVL